MKKKKKLKPRKLDLNAEKIRPQIIYSITKSAADKIKTSNYLFNQIHYILQINKPLGLDLPPYTTIHLFRQHVSWLLFFVGLVAGHIPLGRG